jgi:3-hydroxyisobutyrate dehydrogenase
MSISISQTTQKRTVTVLGTGIIGAPVARNLNKHNFSVRVWNRSKAKADALAEFGIYVADTPAEAVQDAEVIVTTLNDGQRVMDVLNAAAPGIASGAILAQLSTIGIDAVEPIARFADQHGLVFYDAPVQGSRQPAELGQLIILASGPKAARERVQQIFEAIGKRTVWVSDDAGSGASSRLKLALNSLAFALTHGIAESLALADGLGVDPAQVIEVVTGGPLDNLYFQSKSAAILSNDYKTSFSVVNAVKDAELIVEAARQTSVSVDVATAGLQRFRRALSAGHGDKDMIASYLASSPE